MIKKLTKTDLFFIISLAIAILSLSIYLFTHPYFYDETFYAVIPYRLLNGDSLIQHEWHLTQFSSLFTYLPVKIWLALKGSTEGIYVFLRCIYFLIHTAATIAIYKLFKKYGNWSVAAAIIFFTQAPYRIFAINYNSMFVLFTLFFTLCLLSVYKNKSKYLYIIAGACFAGACICNPFYCCAYILYLLACIIWTRRALFKALAIKLKTFYITRIEKNTAKNQKDIINQIDAFPNMESYSCFFSKEAIIYSFLGIFAVAVIAVSFFFATGGTINSIIENIPNLLNNSEYTITSISIFRKLETTVSLFSKISFEKPYILPAFFLILTLDIKRKSLYHRCFHLSVALIISIAYIFGIIKNFGFYTNFFSLPFLIFSATSYILTENKNKVLFRCMWIPNLIAAIFQYISANTILSSFGFMLVITNIVGVIFVKDLFDEVKIEPNKKQKRKSKTTQSPGLIVYSRFIMCIGLCVQLLFHGYVLQYEQISYKEDVSKATTGPYSGIIMTKQQYQHYTNSIADMDFIKELNTDNAPVLSVSYKNWLYLYNEAPVATYTALSTNTVNKNSLISYYTVNPDKIPKYIYLDLFNYYYKYDSDTLKRNLKILDEMFEFTQEELTNGILFTVDKCKF